MEALRSTWTDSRLDVLNDGVVDLGKRVGGLELKVEDLDMRLGRVETKVEQLDQRLGRVETKVEQMDRRLGNLEGQLRDFSADVKDDFSDVRVDMKDAFARVDVQMLAMRTEFGGYQRTIIQVGGGLIGTLAIGILGILATQI